jgi:hypothetical protein
MMATNDDFTIMRLTWLAEAFSRKEEIRKILLIGLIRAISASVQSEIDFIKISII